MYLSFAGNLSDLIFVFFDPIGQALRKRTLNVVDALTAKHGDKIKLFLSKADDAGNETDRQVSVLCFCTSVLFSVILHFYIGRFIRFIFFLLKRICCYFS